MSEQRDPLGGRQLLLILGWILGLVGLALVQGLNAPEEVPLHRIPAAQPDPVELRVSGEAIPSSAPCPKRPQ